MGFNVISFEFIVSQPNGPSIKERAHTRAEPAVRISRFNARKCAIFAERPGDAVITGPGGESPGGYAN